MRMRSGMRSVAGVGLKKGIPIWFVASFATVYHI
jgi:hypothetical protein